MKYQISAKVAFLILMNKIWILRQGIQLLFLPYLCSPKAPSNVPKLAAWQLNMSGISCLIIFDFFFFFSFLSWVTLPTNRFVAHSGQPVKSQLKCHILERFIMTINLKSIALHSTFMNSALVFFLGLINNSYPVYYNI